MSLVARLNQLAGTVGLKAQGAANVWAGTVGRGLVGALNVKAGNTLPNTKGLLGVLNQLAGTTGLGVNAAAEAIPLGAVPTLRGQQSTVTTSAVGSIACALPVTANAGDLIVLMGQSRGGTTFATPAGYTLQENATGTNKDMLVYYKVAAGGETTVTFDPANTNAMSAWVFVIAAGTFKLASPFDGTLPMWTETTTGLTTVIQAETTLTAKCLILAVVMEIKGDTVAITFTGGGVYTTVGNAFSHNAINGYQTYAYTQSLAVAGSTGAPTISSSTSSTWMQQVVAIKSA